MQDDEKGGERKQASCMALLENVQSHSSRTLKRRGHKHRVTQELCAAAGESARFETLRSAGQFLACAQLRAPDGIPCGRGSKEAAIRGQSKGTKLSKPVAERFMEGENKNDERSRKRRPIRHTRCLKFAGSLTSHVSSLLSSLDSTDALGELRYRWCASRVDEGR